MKFRYVRKRVVTSMVAVFVVSIFLGVAHAAPTRYDRIRLVKEESYDIKLKNFGKDFVALYKKAWGSERMGEKLRDAIDKSLNSHPERPNISFWSDLPEEKKDLRPYIEYMVDIFMNDYSLFIRSIEKKFDEHFMKVTLDFFKYTADRALRSTKNPIALAKIREVSRQRLKGYHGTISSEVLNNIDACVYFDKIYKKAGIYAVGSAVAGSIVAGIIIETGLLASAVANPLLFVALVGTTAGVVGGGVAISGDMTKRWKTPDQIESDLCEAAEKTFRDIYPEDTWRTVETCARRVMREVETEILDMLNESE